MYFLGRMFEEDTPEPVFCFVQQLRKTLNHKDSFKDGQAPPPPVSPSPPPQTNDRRYD
jgi:hypothetical protein